jgi:hypothetical protein
MPQEDAHDVATPWQWRSRPLMVGMLVGMTVFFLAGSLWQLWYLQSRIENAPQVAVSELQVTPCNDGTDARQCMELRRLHLAAVLESNVTARRYHQANVLLMSSVWSRYLGFTTGMILALVGSAFILGQLKIEAVNLSTDAPGWKATFQSTSPGIVMCVLGVLLMVSTIVTLHQLSTRDTALYFGKVTTDATEAEARRRAIYPPVPPEPASPSKQGGPP